MSPSLFLLLEIQRDNWICYLPWLLLHMLFRISDAVGNPIISINDIDCVACGETKINGVLQSHLNTYHQPKSIPRCRINKNRQVLCPKMAKRQKRFSCDTSILGWADRSELQRSTKGKSISQSFQHFMIRPVKTFWSRFFLDFAFKNVEIWPHQFSSI